MRVFITGITGTLGTAIAKIHYKAGDEVYGCARCEMRATRWRYDNQFPVSLYLGDASQVLSNYSDMYAAFMMADRVYHCAAMKHVNLCEENIDEAITQNVLLTSQLSLRCCELDIPLVFPSSDKACLPLGVYGASKLLAERIVVSRGGAVARLCNLIGSSGSVFDYWKIAPVINLTSPLMTRYFIEIEKAARFLVDDVLPGMVCIPYPLKSASIGELAKALGKPTNIIGMRAGETLHQYIVAPGERYIALRSMLVVGDGELTEGICSLFAPIWNAQELLSIAGLI